MKNNMTNMSSAPLVLISDGASHDASDVALHDMLAYPREVNAAEAGSASDNRLLYLDSTLELLLSSLIRNREYGFALTQHQRSLLEQVASFL